MKSFQAKAFFHFEANRFSTWLVRVTLENDRERSLINEIACNLQIVSECLKRMPGPFPRAYNLLQLVSQCLVDDSSAYLCYESSASRAFYSEA